MSEQKHLYLLHSSQSSRFYICQFSEIHRRLVGASQDSVIYSCLCHQTLLSREERREQQSMEEFSTVKIDTFQSPTTTCQYHEYNLGNSSCHHHLGHAILYKKLLYTEAKTAWKAQKVTKIKKLKCLWILKRQDNMISSKHKIIVFVSVFQSVCWCFWPYFYPKLSQLWSCFITI